MKLVIRAVLLVACVLFGALDMQPNQCCILRPMSAEGRFYSPTETETMFCNGTLAGSLRHEISSPAPFLHLSRTAQVIRPAQTFSINKGPVNVLSGLIRIEHIVVQGT